MLQTVLLYLILRQYEAFLCWLLPYIRSSTQYRALGNYYSYGRCAVARGGGKIGRGAREARSLGRFFPLPARRAPRAANTEEAREYRRSSRTQQKLQPRAEARAARRSSRIQQKLTNTAQAPTTTTTTKEAPCFYIFFKFINSFYVSFTNFNRRNLALFHF